MIVNQRRGFNGGTLRKRDMTGLTVIAMRLLRLAARVDNVGLGRHRVPRAEPCLADEVAVRSQRNELFNGPFKHTYSASLAKYRTNPSGSTLANFWKLFQILSFAPAGAK